MKTLNATLNATQKSVLLSIYYNGYSSIIDKKAHNRNVMYLRDNGYLYKDNSISVPGIQYVLHTLQPETIVSKAVTKAGTKAVTKAGTKAVTKAGTKAVTKAGNTIDFSKLTKSQLIALLQNPNFELIADKAKPVTVPSDTIELIDRKKRAIQIDKKIFEAYLKAIEGKTFTSYETVNSFNINFAKKAKLIKIAKKDDKVKISNNFETDTKLHLVHFLNSYCYKNNYMK